MSQVGLYHEHILGSTIYYITDSTFTMTHLTRDTGATLTTNFTSITNCITPNLVFLLSRLRSHTIKRTQGVIMTALISRTLQKTRDYIS